MNSEVLIEESLLGWKEFELEVMRDGSDAVMLVPSPSIEPLLTQPVSSAEHSAAVSRVTRDFMFMAFKVRVVERRAWAGAGARMLAC